MEAIISRGERKKRSVQQVNGKVCNRGIVEQTLAVCLNLQIIAPLKSGTEIRHWPTLRKNGLFSQRDFQIPHYLTTD